MHFSTCSTTSVIRGIAILYIGVNRRISDVPVLMEKQLQLLHQIVDRFAPTVFQCCNGEFCSLLSVVTVGASERPSRWSDFSLLAANAPSRRCTLVRSLANTGMRASHYYGSLTAPHFIFAQICKGKRYFAGSRGACVVSSATPVDHLQKTQPVIGFQK